ncbi:MAG: hypothetical protein LBT49_03315 [Prevotellaceae bacterium]|jgi:nitrite reductase/ring-hydroxylating ferredoxin subunit|nr:hypothetical protein [Prevotellaceae bacterium]
MKSRTVFVLFLLLSAIVPFSCAKEDEPALPYVKVDFYVNLLVYSDLQNGKSLIKEHEGYNRNGVIIVPTGYGPDAEFRAYDATCTRNTSEETTAVKLDRNNATATCPKCKTVYNLLNGYAVDQTFHLQEYAVRRSGNNLYITTY